MIQRTPSNQGGLVIREGIGISQSETGKVMSKFDTMPIVERDLSDMGLKDKHKPTFDIPEITAEVLNTTDNRDYTRIYAEQLAWFNYLAPLYAEVRSRLLQAENQRELVEANIKKGLLDIGKEGVRGPKKPTAEEIRIEVLNDPTYQEIMLETQYRTQQKYQLDAWVEIIERNLRVISRQVEIKKIEIGGHQSESGIPQRTPYGPVRR